MIPTSGNAMTMSTHAVATEGREPLRKMTMAASESRKMSSAAMPTSAHFVPSKK